MKKKLKMALEVSKCHSELHVSSVFISFSLFFYINCVIITLWCWRWQTL